MPTDPLWWMCRLTSFLRYNAYNPKEKDKKWAHVTAMRAFFLMQWHDTSQRFVVCWPAVRRMWLQAAKFWTDFQNNRYNTRNNAYYSLRSAEYVDLASLSELDWSSQSFAGTPGHLSVIARHIVRELASAIS